MDENEQYRERRIKLVEEGKEVYIVKLVVTEEGGIGVNGIKHMDVYNELPLSGRRLVDALAHAMANATRDIKIPEVGEFESLLDLEAEDEILDSDEIE